MKLNDSLKNYRYRVLTRKSADADKPARHVWRPVKVTKHGTIRYVRYGFLLVFYSKSVRRSVFEIFDFNNAVTLKTGLDVRQGHWKCHHSIESVWLPITVTMSLSHVVSEIFNVEKYRDLEIPVKGHQGTWKWYHSIDCIWFPCGNFVPKTDSFFRYAPCKCTVTLKPGLEVTQGHRNWHVSIRHPWLPINVAWQLRAYLVPFPR